MEWQAPAGGGGKVLQVVYGTSSTSTTVASTTYTDCGLSASITPTSASSTILIFVTQASAVSGNGSDLGVSIRLLRDSTAIHTPLLNQYMYVGARTGNELRIPNTMVYRDSPATTSSVTYKTQARLTDTVNSMSSTFQKDNAISSLTFLEIGA